MQLYAQQEPLKEEPAGSLSLSHLVPKGHKLYHLFNFIGQNYGNNPANILRAFGSIIDFDKGLRALLSSKLSLKNTVNLLRYSLPAALYSLELGIKIRNYIKELRKGELSEHDRMKIRVLKLLEADLPDIENGERTEVETWHTDIVNEDIIEWILKNPRTKGFKILGFYNHNLDKLEQLPDDFKSTIILIEFRNKKILLDVTVKTFGSLSFLERIIFVGQFPVINQDLIKDLEMQILKNFILTFNIKENILEFKGGVITKKRAVVEERINQFELKPLIKEIKKVLKHRRKRGYAFIGKQGTGKSVIMLKIEEILKDTIIIKISPNEFSTSGGIKRCFNLIRTVQPALVIIEDLDAFRFKDKNERVGTFIKEIDDSNLNAVFLITVNDPEMIHRTIIDRPGRFDEIFEIKPPQTQKEAYQVMKSKYDKLIDYYTGFQKIPFPSMKKFNHGILDRCIKNNFTQAELTNGIIEKIFLYTQNPKDICFNDMIVRAIESFEVSKKSLKTYKFNEEEMVYNEPVPEDLKCTEEVRSMPQIGGGG